MHISDEVDNEPRVDLEQSLDNHTNSVRSALNAPVGKDEAKQAVSIGTTLSSNSGGNNDFRDDVESEAVKSETNTRPDHAETKIPSDPNVVGWDSDTDPENPLNWTSSRRWTLIILVSLVSFMSGLSSSFFAPSVPGMMKEFQSTNQTLAAFVVTVFVLGLSAGPLASGPLSELYGRLIVFQTGNFGFLIFTIASGVATNLDMMIVFRFFQGCFAATPFTLGGAVIADVVHQEERGRAIAIFTFGVLFGPSVGPVMGGFLAAAKGWRWVFWVLAMPLGTLTIICFVFFRESYAPVLLARKAARLRKETGNPNLRSKYDRGDTASAHFKRGIGRAVKMLIWSPVILALSVYSGLSYAYFYLLITTLTPVFERTYRFPPDTVGLSYLGLGIGYMGGVALSAVTADRIFLRLTARHHGERRPEYRLILTMTGGFCLPIAFFWFGWSADKKLHWIVPIIGTSFLGCGGAFLLMSIQNYTIDAYTLYAASGLAANTIVRSMMASTIPLAAPALYDKLGLGWGNSLLAFLALGMAPLPWLFYFKGEKMRGWNAKRIQNL